jgi:SPP1 gp7 family putative phage head morphogenesis protein
VLKDGGLADLLAARDIWIKGIGETTVNAIGNRIAQGLAIGEGVPSISAGIRDYLGNSDRADMIATTEVARAQNEGQSQELQGQGFGGWEWMAYDGACDECMDNDGQTFTWDDPVPPAHPNCRCAIIGASEPSASD